MRFETGLLLFWGSREQEKAKYNSFSIPYISPCFFITNHHDIKAENFPSASELTCHETLYRSACIIDSNELFSAAKLLRRHRITVKVLPTHSDCRKIKTPFVNTSAAVCQKTPPLRQFAWKPGRYQIHVNLAQISTGVCGAVLTARYFRVSANLNTTDEL
jgi:hypothetical protein